MTPCKQNTLSTSPSYISSRQLTSSECSSSRRNGGTQFYFAAKRGQKVKLKAYAFSDVTTQIGYVIDEGNDEVFPLQVDMESGEEVFLAESRSNEVTVSLKQDEASHFLVFLKGMYTLDYS